MAIKQPQFEDIVELLSKTAPIVLASKGLDGLFKDTEKLIHHIRRMGNIIPSHKCKLYSILRMMFESNTY